MTRRALVSRCCMTSLSLETGTCGHRWVSFEKSNACQSCCGTWARLNYVLSLNWCEYVCASSPKIAQTHALSRLSQGQGPRDCVLLVGVFVNSCSVFALFFMLLCLCISFVHGLRFGSICYL